MDDEAKIAKVQRQFGNVIDRDVLLSVLEIHAGDVNQVCMRAAL